MTERPRCPRCGDPMEVGAIYSARWIRWLPEGATAPATVGQLKHEALVDVSWRSFRPQTAPARRCASCRVVEFAY